MVVIPIELVFGLKEHFHDQSLSYIIYPKLFKSLDQIESFLLVSAATKYYPDEWKSIEVGLLGILLSLILYLGVPSFWYKENVLSQQPTSK